MLKDLSKKYFLAFAKKDIQALEKMFDQSITLSDWDNQADGIEEVMLVYRQIFRLMKYINITIVNEFLQESVVITELVLKIKGRESLRIVDIITFTKHGKICSIKAYKG
jgi:hypothetical protein